MNSLICFAFVFREKCLDDTSARRFDISADYFNSQDDHSKEVLRTNSESDTCLNPAFQVLCHMQCKGDHICVSGQCYCLKSADSSRGQSSHVTKSNSVQLPSHFDDNDYDEGAESVQLYPVTSKLALRHQIAHFCPDLDLARACISKCMEQGKPAFCGKDHKCYCGHRDMHTLNAGKKIDAYKQYKDMYAKYLGAKVLTT